MPSDMLYQELYANPPLREQDVKMYVKAIKVTSPEINQLVQHECVFFTVHFSGQHLVSVFLIELVQHVALTSEVMFKEIAISFSPHGTCFSADGPRLSRNC